LVRAHVEFLEAGLVAPDERLGPLAPPEVRVAVDGLLLGDENPVAVLPPGLVGLADPLLVGVGVPSGEDRIGEDAVVGRPPRQDVDPSGLAHVCRAFEVSNLHGRRAASGD
jgi:hypothetical protein